MAVKIKGGKEHTSKYTITGTRWDDKVDMIFSAVSPSVFKANFCTL